MNPHSSVLETDALIQLSYTPRNLVHGEGLEPPKSVKTSDLQSDAFAALPTMRKFGIVKNKRAQGTHVAIGV